MAKVLEMDEEICPNCGQYIAGETECPNCGAILKKNDGGSDLSGFHEEIDDLADDDF